MTQGTLTIERARPARRSRAAALALAGLLLAAAVLYGLTLDTGLQPGQLLGGDLITHQYAQVQGRMSNAPGYPLYTMGGWLWFHGGRLLLGPGANPIAILSSYSTLWALLALGLLFGLIMELTDHGHGGNWVVALLVSAFLGVTYFFWYYAVNTEQYTSAVAWTIAVVWLALRWDRTRREGCLLGISLLTGVALAHMLTLLIIIPPVLLFVLWREPKLLRRPRLIAAALGLAALPLISYVYVYLAGAQHPEWRGAGQWASNWQWFLSFISTSQGRSELTWSWTPFFTAEFPRLIWAELTWPGLILGLLGLARLGRGRGRARAALLYACLAVYLIFCWIDRQGNWFQVIMPAYALVILGLALLADAAWQPANDGKSDAPSAWHAPHQVHGDFAAPPLHPLAHASGRPVPPSPVGKGVRGLGLAGLAGTPAVRGAVVLALAALVLYRGALSFPQANSRDRGNDTGLAPGWAVLADNPPPGTVVLGTLPEELALNYVTEIWGERPDLRSVTSAQARAALAQGTPVAVTSAALPLVPQEVSPDAHYSALGPMLVALSAAPAKNVPAELAGWSEDFGAGLAIVGGQAGPRADGSFVVRLAWLAQHAPDQDWSVSVRLLQGDKQLAQQDQAHPVFGAYPTTRWSAGEVVGDVYRFDPIAGVRPDTVEVILYRPADGGGFVNQHVARFAIAGGNR